MKMMIEGHFLEVVLFQLKLPKLSKILSGIFGVKSTSTLTRPIFWPFRERGKGLLKKAFQLLQVVVLLFLTMHLCVFENLLVNVLEGDDYCALVDLDYIR